MNEQELREHTAKRIAKFKVPGKIWFRDEPLPVGATGKVQKKDFGCPLFQILDSQRISVKGYWTGP